MSADANTGYELKKALTLLGKDINENIDKGDFCMLQTLNQNKTHSPLSRFIPPLPKLCYIPIYQRVYNIQ